MEGIEDLKGGVDFNNIDEMVDDLWLFLTNDKNPHRAFITQEAFAHEAKAMIESCRQSYTKQQAIAFEDWAAHNRPKYEKGHKWICAGKIYEQPPTSEELYAQFIESQNK